MNERLELGSRMQAASVAFGSCGSPLRDVGIQEVRRVVAPETEPLSL